MKRVLQILASLITANCIISTVLFVSQGGFAGGHLHFDKAIFTLALPWVLIPWPEVIWRYDFVPFILIPFIMNAAVWGALLAAKLRISGHGPA